MWTSSFFNTNVFPPTDGISLCVEESIKEGILLDDDANCWTITLFLFAILCRKKNEFPLRLGIEKSVANKRYRFQWVNNKNSILIPIIKVKVQEQIMNHRGSQCVQTTHYRDVIKKSRRPFRSRPPECFTRSCHQATWAGLELDRTSCPCPG